jgi:hypothetical protein
VAWFGAAMLVPLSLLAAHAGRIGWRNVVAWLYLEPRASFAGRLLPLPPRDPEMLLLFLLALGAAIALATIGAVRFFRARSSLEARFDLVLGIACVVFLPQLLQRADSWHVRCAGILAIALVPSVTMSSAGRMRRWASSLCVLAICAFFAAAPLRDDLRAAFRRPGAPVFVERAGRRFPLADPAHATEIQFVLDALDRYARPGEKVFVGPEDLRRTNLDDVFVYYLLPELRPASYFTAMVPGLDTERLAREIASADYLLLTTRYDAWTEPNASSVFGSSLPSEVVERSFCRVARLGSYSLFVRCA